MLDLDEKTQLLLNVIQDDLPLVERPYKALGEKVGLSEEEVVARVAKLKANKILRQVSTIFDTRSLGWQSSLVACKAPPGKIDEVAEVLNRHPGVSHNYARRHDFNIWFTIGIPGESNLQEHIDVLQQELLPRYADEIIAIHLAPWRMNLDGGFVPVADDVIVSDTSSIVGAELIEPDRRTRLDLWAMLADLGIRVVDTTPEESVYAQSCNYLCLGDRRIIGYDLCPRVIQLLEQHDIRVYPVAGSELIKGRGGPRCMTRPIYLPLD